MARIREIRVRRNPDDCKRKPDANGKGKKPRSFQSEFGRAVPLGWRTSRSVWSLQTQKRLLVGLGTRRLGLSCVLRCKSLVSAMLYGFFGLEFLVSAASLLALSGHPPRPKAGASSTHFKRFATFGCGFAAFAALGHPWSTPLAVAACVQEKRPDLRPVSSVSRG